jgi:SAM-dependent methyltransferase
MTRPVADPATPPTPPERFTDESYWDEYWEGRALQLPARVVRKRERMQVNALLDVFDRHLEPGRDELALEIGGAPGQYLAYLHGQFGYRCAILDFSHRGCELARRNFELLNIPADVYERDLLDPMLDIGPFDVVYSLGLIEHFADIESVVAAHARLVRPGGTLIVGVPNVQGVNQWFMKRLGPNRLAAHNPAAMELARWDTFEATLGLERQFRGYIGGFEPGVFAVLEGRNPRQLALFALTRLLIRTVGTHFPGLRRFNHPKLSGYLIGVWKVPAPAPPATTGIP